MSADNFAIDTWSRAGVHIKLVEVVLQLVVKSFCGITVSSYVSIQASPQLTISGNDCLSANWEFCWIEERDPKARNHSFLSTVQLCTPGITKSCMTMKRYVLLILDVYLNYGIFTLAYRLQNRYTCNCISLTK